MRIIKYIIELLCTSDDERDAPCNSRSITRAEIRATSQIVRIIEHPRLGVRPSEIEDGGWGRCSRSGSQNPCIMAHSKAPDCLAPHWRPKPAGSPALGSVPRGSILPQLALRTRWAAAGFLSSLPSYLAVQPVLQTIFLYEPEFAAGFTTRLYTLHPIPYYNDKTKSAFRSQKVPEWVPSL